MTEKKKRKCSLCGEPGHQRNNCKNSPFGGAYVHENEQVLLIHKKEAPDMKKRNWTEEDIGKKVTIEFEHGTTMEDTIVSIPLELPIIKRDAEGNEYAEMLGDGQLIVGPSIEIGMIHARLTHSLPLIELLKLQQEALQKAAEDFSDEEEGV
tara:strand:+ start:1059 stop:1514 length:456 start_codon:yes stop_codon:yes gene_type:complete